MYATRSILLAILLAGACYPSSQAASFQQSIQIIREVGPKGLGNEAAAEAWRVLAATDVGSLVVLLEGMDGANDLALNWLRAAVDAVVEQAASQGKELPLTSLERFVNERHHNPRARGLAYELIASVDPEAASRLRTRMLDDPSPELRRDAVQRLVDEANALKEEGKTNAAIVAYQAALKPARAVDQILAIVDSLKGLGSPADLGEVFGWVATWNVIGPFDNTGLAGYDRVYPPEQTLDLDAEYNGKLGKVRWRQTTSTNEFGLVDLNQPLGELKEVTGYAWTEFIADKSRPVELRLGCKNGWKVWFNGELLSERDEYHLKTQIDHFRLPGHLRAGTNTILVKLCQNAEVKPWTKQWEFQMRVTDEIGTPVFSATE